MKDTAAQAYELAGDALYLRGALVLANVDAVLPLLMDELATYPHDTLRINFDDLERLDSAGVVALNALKRRLEARGVQVSLEGGSEHIRKIFNTFSVNGAIPAHEARGRSALEFLGEKAHRATAYWMKRFFFSMADIFYWSLVDLFRRKTYRQGEFVRQADLIGARAVPIVIALAFLIGLVLALQASEQLRQFGANVFIVDLTVIGMLREMGPLLTAIVVAGRSGSAIASEIATLKITEELDALTTMGLDPIRFVVVPKLYACVFAMPFLTILANVFGILGGMVTALFSLDIAPMVYVNRMEEVLVLRDLATGMVKSVVFGGLIVLTGSFSGLQAEKGADDVGRVTTASVVVSISLVIVADSILGLIFY